jgi:3-hydroxyisobutyrate dehydrogenase-like beta-hydroxyacid dehydrogenase
MKIKSYIIIIEQVKIVSSPKNAVENSEFIILMLPNGKIVRDVCQSNVFP